MRDDSNLAQSSASGGMDDQLRLTEIASTQGYRVTRTNTKVKGVAPNTVTLVEGHAALGDGQERTFYGLVIRRENKPNVRCYWQFNDSDRASAREFDDFLTNLTCDEISVGKIVWEGVAMATAAAPATAPEATTANATTGAPSTPAASPESSPATLISSNTAELVSKFQNSLAVIEGENGVGSGFVCKLEGQPWLMTNIHVLANNPQPRFRTMNGQDLTLGPSVLGVNHDIFRGTVPETDQMLEVMPDLDQNLKIGDEIVVLGNPEGAGVIKPLEGRVVGIGPNLVEVDAPFVQGNSGSPIIHVATGKVVGIATYLITRKVDSNGKEGVTTSVRRFGYRVDSVKNWEPVNWAAFYTQSQQAAQVYDTGEEFVALFKSAREKTLRSSDYKYPGIQRALLNLEKAHRSSSRMSESDRSAVLRMFLGELRAAALKDVNSFDSRTAYDYFKREIAKEKQFRDDIYQHLTRVMEANR